MLAYIVIPNIKLDCFKTCLQNNGTPKTMPPTSVLRGAPCHFLVSHRYPILYNQRLEAEQLQHGLLRRQGRGQDGEQLYFDIHIMLQNALLLRAMRLPYHLRGRTAFQQCFLPVDGSLLHHMAWSIGQIISFVSQRRQHEHLCTIE